MKKIVKLTESQLIGLVKQTIKSLTEQGMGITSDEITRNLYGDNDPMANVPPRKTEIRKTENFTSKDLGLYQQYLDKFKKSYADGTYNTTYKMMVKSMDPQSKSVFDEMQKTSEPFYYGLINKVHSIVSVRKVKHLKISIQKVNQTDYRINWSFDKIN